MRTPDLIMGLLLAIFSAGAFVVAQGFPAAPGRPIGASEFPMLVSGILFACSALLIAGALLKRQAADTSAQETQKVVIPRYSPGTWAVIAVIAISPFFYVNVVGTLGYLITATVIVFTLSLLLWGGIVRSAVLAVASAFVTDGLFRGLFMVPLAGGILPNPFW